MPVDTESQVKGPVTADVNPPEAEPQAEPQAVTEPTDIPAPETKQVSPQPPQPPQPEDQRLPAADEGKKHAAVLREKESQLAAAHKANAELLLRQQIIELQAQEQQAAGKDQREVADGSISQSEAEQRRNTRAQHYRMQLEMEQLKQQHQALRMEAESAAYVQVAHQIAQKLATEEGLDANEAAKLNQELLSGEKCENPYAMEAKALRIMNRQHRDALRKSAAKPENYDKGPGSSSYGRTSDDAFLKAFNAGQLNSDADFNRAQEIIDKL